MRGALGYLVLLSIAHLITDLNQGGMPALLPQLKEDYGLTYAQLGVVLLVLHLWLVPRPDPAVRSVPGPWLSAAYVGVVLFGVVAARLTLAAMAQVFANLQGALR